MLWLLSKSEHKYHNHCPYKITARWGCRTLKSFVRPKFSENALSHLLHWNNFSTVCLCISIIEVVFHSKGRITLAILIWSFPSVCSKMNNKITFLYISLYIMVCFGDGSLTSLERLQLFIEVLSTSIFESLFTPSIFTMLASLMAISLRWSSTRGSANLASLASLPLAAYSFLWALRFLLPLLLPCLLLLFWSHYDLFYISTKHWIDQNVNKWWNGLSDVKIPSPFSFIYPDCSRTIENWPALRGILRNL